MKYRHQYHAGNFADVHKHVLLLEVLRALTRKDKGLLFVDTHAGRGDYDLHPGDARASRRMAGGRRETAGRRAAPCGAVALPRPGRARACTAAACTTAARRCSRCACCAPVDRAVFFETQREEAGHLRKLLEHGARARVEGGDGFAGLRALLPPPERRGCVLIDPPYEEREDFTRVHRRGARRTAALRERGAACCGCRVKLRARLRRLVREAAARVAAAGARLAAVDASDATRAPRSTARRWWSSTRPI